MYFPKARAAGGSSSPADCAATTPVYVGAVDKSRLTSCQREAPVQSIIVTPPEPFTRRELVLLGVVLAAAACLRLADLSWESYWLDELVSVTDAHRSWGSLVADLSGADVHPPHYFALLKGWVGCFGESEAATRSLSAIFGVAAVLFGSLFARRLGGRRAGLAAAALLAFSPFCLYYSREVRPYGLLLALSLASTWLLVRSAPELRVRALAAYVPTAAALLYTHVYGLFTLAAHAVFALALARREGWRRPVLRLFGALLCVGLLFAPWVPATLGQTRRVAHGFWVPPPAPLAWTKVWLAEGFHGVAWVLGTTALSIAAFARLWREERPVAWLVGAGVALPTLVPIALSTVGQPVFLAKYAIAATGLWVTCAGLRAARRRLQDPAQGAVAGGGRVHLGRRRRGRHPRRHPVPDLPDRLSRPARDGAGRGAVGARGGRARRPPGRPRKESLLAR